MDDADDSDRTAGGSALTPLPAARGVRREVLLDTPRNPSPRKRTLSNAETDERELREIMAELNAAEEELERLKDDHSRAKARRRDEVGKVPAAGRGIAITDVAEDEEELESLEAMLRQMDDGALAALLTAGSRTPAIDEALLQVLPKDAPPAVLAPARSAGIEGTGTGQQIDEDEQSLAQATNEALDDQLEAALLGRKARSEELSIVLARFTGLALQVVSTSEPVRNERDKTRMLRRIRMRGMLEGDLGTIVLDLDVEDREDKKEKKTFLPQIVALDVEVDDAVFFALGADQIKAYVERVDLPALLLAIRTAVPLAIARYRLFTAVARLFPALTAEQKRNWRSRGVTMKTAKDIQESVKKELGKLPALSLLIEPDVMESFAVQSSNGVKLSFRFAITFTKWGHAQASLSAMPEVPTQFVRSPRVEKTLNNFAERFTHFCAHRPSYADMRTVMAATITAFFAL